MVSGGDESVLGANAVTTSLCETCRNVREVRTARSRFLLCELSAAHPEYPKYPPQPVVRCDGYRKKEPTEGIAER
jgi:hypothetical protein